MKILTPCRGLAQRLFVASIVLALAGCASVPWDNLFSDAPAASSPALLSPAPVAAGFYRVNPGDTLASVASAFGRDRAQLAGWNRLPDDDAVSVGQVLRVAPYQAQASASQSKAAAAAAAPAVASRQTRFVWPASGPVTMGFDEGQSRAIRIAGVAGETIKAAGDGRVIYAGSQIKAYGQLVIIKHDKRFVSAYGNNAKLLVKEGDAVRQGQPIAEMGGVNDPNAYLIFELRDATKAVDPQNYLPKRSG